MPRLRQRLRLRDVLLAGTMIAGALPQAWANPGGGQVVAGSASITTAPGQVDVTQSTASTVIDWRSFSIGKSERVDFIQPSSNAVALNRVVGPDPSTILGRLTANGAVFLVNPNGVVFGRGSVVNVGSILATTADIANADFMAGRYAFNKPSANLDARVVNEGQITVASRGMAAFVAPGVENSGVIAAKLGHVILGGAEAFAIDLYGDGLTSFEITQPVSHAPRKADGTKVAALVTNSGTIQANGGTVLLTARAAEGVIDQAIGSGGVVEAKSVGVENGTIVLSGEDSGSVSVSGTLDASGNGAGQTGGTVKVLGEQVVLTPTARVNASGAAGGGTVLVGGNFHGAGPDRNATRTVVETGAAIVAGATGAGSGGRVAVWSDSETLVGGAISVRGGPRGGNGGFVETSSKNVLTVAKSANIDAAAPQGKAGTWLLDPKDILVQTGGAGAITDVSTYSAHTGVSETIDPATILTGMHGGATVTLQAGNDLTIVNAINAPTNDAAATGSLVLQAGHSIDANDSIVLNGGSFTAIANDSTHANVSGTGDPADRANDGGAGGKLGNFFMTAGKTIDTSASASASISITVGPSASNISTGTDYDPGVVTLADLKTGASGTLSVTGAYTALSQQSGDALTIGSTSTFSTTASGGTITLANSGNALKGVVTFSTTGSGADVQLTNAVTGSGTILGPSTVGGALTVVGTDSFGITETGVLSVTGTSSFTDTTAGAKIDLSTSTNALTGAVTLSNGASTGAVKLANNVAVTGTILASVTTGGNLTVVGSDSFGITQTGAVSVGGTSSFTDTVTNAKIDLSTSTNALTGAVTLSNGTSTGAVKLTNSVSGTGTILASVTTGGALTVVGTDTFGITQTGTLSVTGASSFTDTAANAKIDLGTSTNALKGGITLNNGASTGVVNLKNAVSGTGTVLASVTTGGALTVVGTDSFGITQTGALSVTGASSFTDTTANAKIDLSTSTNALTGGITLSNGTSTGAVKLKNSVSGTGTVLASVTTGGALSVVGTDSFGITQTGALSVGGTSSFTDTTGGAEIDLSTSTNALTGGITLSNGASTDVVKLTNAVSGTGTVLSSVTTGGALTITDSDSAGISQTGALSVGGASSFTTSASGATIALGNGSNALTGAVTLSTTGAGADASLTNNLATTLNASTVGGNATIVDETGTLTLSGNLLTTGAISLTANAMSLGGVLQIGGSGVGTGQASSVTLAPESAGRKVNLGGTSDPGTDLYLSTTALTNVRAGTLIVGGTTDTSLLKVIGTLDPTTNGLQTIANLTLVAGSGGIEIGGAMTLTPGGNLTLNSAGAVTQDSTDAITLSGAGGLLLKGNGAFTLNEPTNSIPLVASSGAIGSLSLTDSAAITIGTVGGGTGLTTSGGTVGVTAASGITLTGAAVATSGGSVTLTGPVTLSGDQTVTTTGSSGTGDVTFTSTVDGSSAGAQALTVNARGTIAFDGAVGGSTYLKSLSATAGSQVTTTGAITTAGNVTLSAAAGDLVLNGINANSGLAAAGGGNVSLTATTGAISENGVSLIVGNQLSTTSRNATTLGNNNLISTLAGNTVTGSGSLTFTDAPGTSLTVAGVVTTGGGDAAVSASNGITLEGLSFATSGGSVTLTGSVTVAADQTIDTTGSSGVGNVTFTSTVDDFSAGGQALTVNARGTIAFDGAVGGTTHLKSLSATAGGQITTSAAITTTGDLTLSAASGSLLLNGLNAHGGIGTAGGGNVSLTATAGGISENGAATITGNQLTLSSAGLINLFPPNAIATLETVNVTGGGNGLIFWNATPFTVAGEISTNGGLVALHGAVTLDGPATVIATKGSSVSFDAPVTLAADQTIDTKTGAGAPPPAGDVTFGSTIDDSSAGAHVLTIDALGTVGFGGAVGGATALKSLSATGGAISSLPVIRTTGSLALTAVTGSIAQTGALSVGGTSAFTTDASGATITLNNGLNVLTGAVSLNTVGTGADASLTNDAAGGTMLAASTVGGGLTIVNTLGNLAQSGALAVTGGSSFTDSAIGATITLTNGSNALTGAVSLNTVGTGADASLTNNASGGTVLAGSNIGGGLTVVSSRGNLSQSGVLSVAGLASFTDTASGATLDLSGATNLIAGAVTLDNGTSTGGVKLTNGAAGAGTALASITTSGNLVVVGTDAIGITEAGALSVGGTSSFTDTTTGAKIDLSTATNALAGGITLNNGTSTGVVKLNNAVSGTGTILASVTTGGALTVVDSDTAGISQTGGLSVAGSASFTSTVAGASITLTNGGNALAGTVSFSTFGAGANARLNNAEALGTVVGTSSAGGSFTIDETLGGLTVAGAVTTQGAAINLVAAGSAGLALDAAVNAKGSAESAGAVTLNANGGGISQSSAGVITAGLLTTSSLHATGLDGATNQVAQVTGQVTGTTAATDSFALLDGSDLIVAPAAVTTAGGAIALTSQGTTGLALHGAVNATSAGNVTLAANSGGISQNSSGVITAALLSTSTLHATALDGATNQVAQLTGSVTGTNAATDSFAFLDGLDLTIATGGILTGGGAIALTSQGTTGIALDDVVNATISGLVTLTANSGGISQLSGGAITAATLNTASHGDTQLATASNAVTAASGTAGGAYALGSGTVNLQLGPVGAASISATNSGGITVVGGLTTGGGAVDLTATTSDLALDAAVNATTTGNVTLTASGGIIAQNAAGIITAGLLTISSLHGTELTGAVNQASQLTAQVTGADAATDGFAFLNGSDLTVVGSGVTTGGGAITLTSHGGTGLDLGGAVNATSAGSVTLTASAGSITESGGGQVTAGLLTTRSLHATSLAESTNQVAQATGQVTGTNAATDAYTLHSATDLTIASPGLTTAGGAIALTSDGASGLMLNGIVNATSGGSVALAAGNGAISQSSAGVITARLLTTSSLNATALGAAVNQVAQATGQVTGADGFTLVDGSNLTVAASGISDGGGAIALTTRGTAGINLAGAVNATAAGSVALTAAGSISQTSTGVITAGLLTTSSLHATSLTTAVNQVAQATGQVTGANKTTDIYALLDGTDLTVVDGPGIVTGGGSIALTSQGATGLVLQATVDATATGSVTLSAPNGSISQNSAGVITAGLLITSSLHATALDGAINQVAQATGTVSGTDAATDSYALLDGLNLAVVSPGITTAGGAISLTSNGATGLVLDAPVNATGAGAVTLTATAGGISQTGAGIVTAGLLTTSSLQATALTGAPNQVTQATGQVTGTNPATDTYALLDAIDLAIVSPGITTVGGSISLTVQGGTGLALNDPVDAGGGAVAFSTPNGGISQTSGGIVTAGLLTTSSLRATDLGVATNAVARFTGTVTGTDSATDGLSLLDGATLTVTNSGVTTHGGAADLTGQGAGGLTLDGAVATSGGAVTVTAAGGIVLDGPSPVIGGGAILLTGPVSLDADQTIGAAGGAGAITIDGTIDGAHALTIRSDGALVLAGTVGGATPLASLDASAGSISAGSVSTTGSILLSAPGGITLNGQRIGATAGNVTFGGPVLLAADQTVSAGGAIDFTGTVDGPAGLTLSAGGAVALTGAAGGTTRLANLTATADTITANSIAATGNIGLSAVHQILLDGAGIATSGGSLSFTGPIRLASDQTISAAGGSIIFGSTVDSAEAATPHALTVSDSGGTVTFTQSLGATPVNGGALLPSLALASLGVDAGTINLGTAGTADFTIRTAGPARLQSYKGDQAATLPGDIRLNGAVNLLAQTTTLDTANGALTQNSFLPPVAVPPGANVLLTGPVNGAGKVLSFVLGNGNALGTGLVLGGISINGFGGSSTLVGTINGNPTNTAAEPPNGQKNQPLTNDYTFNHCAVGSSSCQTFAVILPVTLTTPQALTLTVAPTFVDVDDPSLILPISGNGDLW